MADRKATEAELRALANGEGLAPNATFDGVNYRVTPQSSESKKKAPVKRKSNSKTAKPKGNAGGPAPRSATTASSGTSGSANDGTAATRGPVTSSGASDTSTTTTNAQAARGPQ